VWRLKVPLYGEADAGRIWNRTLVRQLDTDAAIPLQRERADYSSKNGKVGRKEIMSHISSLVYGDFIVKKKGDLVSQTALY
jgi:hypothetical protein